MEANAQYLPAQILVSYQLSNAPAEVATLHTASALKAFVLESADGRRRNIQHFHNHYIRQNNITGELTHLGLEGMLRYMTVLKGERQTKILADLLTVLDPPNLRWVGRDQPAITIIKDMLEEVSGAANRLVGAACVEMLMDYMAKPETVEFVERYPSFKVTLINKSNELRLIHHLEFPGVAEKCLAVLKAFGGTVVPLPEPEPEPEPEHKPAHVKLTKLVPNHTRIILAIGEYPSVEGVLCFPGYFIYSAKHKRIIPIRWFFNSYVKANGIVLEKTPKNHSDVLKHFYINDQAYMESESLHTMLLNWNPHLLNCLLIQTPEAFEEELEQKRADEEEYQRQEDEWRAQAEKEPCDCYKCSLENEIQGLQKRLRRLEEFIGFDG